MLAGGDPQHTGHLGGDREDGEQLIAPTEIVPREVSEVPDDKLPGLGIGGEGIEKAILRRRVAAGVELHLGIDEGERRHDKALGLEVAHPALVFGKGDFSGVGEHVRLLLSSKVELRLVGRLALFGSGVLFNVLEVGKPLGNHLHKFGIVQHFVGDVLENKIGLHSLDLGFRVSK